METSYCQHNYTKEMSEKAFSQVMTPPHRVLGSRLNSEPSYFRMQSIFNCLLSKVYFFVNFCRFCYFFQFVPSRQLKFSSCESNPVDLLSITVLGTLRLRTRKKNSVISKFELGFSRNKKKKIDKFSVHSKAFQVH